jgi:hypothetical protein
MTMHRLSLAFTFVVGAAIAAPLQAADQKMMIPEEGTLEILLLRQKSVRDELKVTDATDEKIQKYAAQQWKKAQQISDDSQEEQDRQFDAMAKENEKFLEQTLSKEQQQRLHQIVLQQAGLLYVTRKDIASSIKLTEEQKERARKAQKEARQELEELLDAKDAKARNERLNELYKTNTQRLATLLTAEQNTKWKQMIGAPFTGQFKY